MSAAKMNVATAEVNAYILCKILAGLVCLNFLGRYILKIEYSERQSKFQQYRTKALCLLSGCILC